MHLRFPVPVKARQAGPWFSAGFSTCAAALSHLCFEREKKEEAGSRPKKKSESEQCVHCALRYVETRERRVSVSRSLKGIFLRQPYTAATRGTLSARLKATFTAWSAPSAPVARSPAWKAAKAAQVEIGRSRIHDEQPSGEKLLIQVSPPSSSI